MAIFRGVGGSGDSSDNSYLEELTAIANEVEQDKLATQTAATFAVQSASQAYSFSINAENSADDAASYLASVQNVEVTSASFNTGNGVLTLTKLGGGTVTTDLDGRFLTSYTETDPVFSAHASSGITATNISNWNTAYNNHITAVDYSGSTLTLTQQDGGTLTTTINGALGSTLAHNGSTKIEAISSGVTVTGDITVSGTVDGRDLATDGTKLDGIEANADVTDTANVTAAGALMDSEVTNLAQVKAFDSSDYLTTHQDISGKANLSGADFTGDVTTSGRAGIGTDSPNGRLHVYDVQGDGSNDWATPLATFETTGSAAQIRIKNSSSSATNGLDLKVSGPSATIQNSMVAGGGSHVSLHLKALGGGSGLFIDSYQNNGVDGTANFDHDVGIATDNPDSKLHVYGGDIRVTSDSDTHSNTHHDGKPSLIFNEFADDHANYVEGVAHAIITYNGGGETGDAKYLGLGVFDQTVTTEDTLAEQKLLTDLNITRDGKVGIGTTEPSEALDVDGNIAVSGTVDGVDIAGLQTTVTGKANLSGASFTGDVNLGDNNKINIGASSDLQIYHDGSNSYIDEQGTGDLIVKGLSEIIFQRADTGTSMFMVRPNRVESYDASGNLITKVDADGLDVTGELSTTDTITAPNVNISTTGTVTTNIATGANSGSSTKVVNIATGYSTGGTTTVNIAPTSSTTTKQINLNGDVSIGGAVTSEIDATIASPSQNTPVLKLRKNSASANGTGRFITFVSSTTSGGSEVTRGLVGLSNTTSPQYSNPFMSHTSGSNGIVFSYSGNSSYNAIAPCSSTGSASNGSLNLGHGFAKWNTVYASSGSINTSDITKKQDIEELSEAESRVAIAAKGLLRKYRWKDSVSEKGDNARIHFGIMAQDLKAAFEAEGLDANKYGMFCADTRWTTDGTDTYATEEEAPEAVTEETVYGVRYEELLAFIIAAL